MLYAPAIIMNTMHVTMGSAIKSNDAMNMIKIVFEMSIMTGDITPTTTLLTSDNIFLLNSDEFLSRKYSYG